MGIRDKSVSADARIDLFKTALSILSKTGDYTVVEEDMGQIISAQGSSADIDFILPSMTGTYKRANWVIFMQAVDFEMRVTSPEGDNIIAANNLLADSLSITTASEHIGGFLLFVRDVATSRWLATGIGHLTATAAG